MQDDKNIYSLSYNTFLDDMQRFKKAGGPNTDSFNFFDSPSNKYYKIFFYFGTRAEVGNYDIETVGKNELSGLLAPAWLYESEVLNTLADHEAVNPYFENQVNTTYAFKPSEAPVYRDTVQYVQPLFKYDNFNMYKRTFKEEVDELPLPDENRFQRDATYMASSDMVARSIQNLPDKNIPRRDVVDKLVSEYERKIDTGRRRTSATSNNENNTSRTSFSATSNTNNENNTSRALPTTNSLKNDRIYPISDNEIIYVYKGTIAIGGSEKETTVSEDQYNNEKKAHNARVEAAKNDYNRRVAEAKANYNTAYANWERHEAERKVAYNIAMKKIADDLSVRQFTFASSNYVFNTAYNYLKLNGKVIIASQLRSFIELLSNISIESPWYFTNVAGITNCKSRMVMDTRKPEFGEQGKLTITCLPDAFDNRIGTLLDLYRSIAFDSINKRELIPANLRKFDMAIYIFEAPDQTWHKEDTKDIKKLGEQWVNAFDSSITSALRLKQLKDDATKQYASFDLSSEGFHPSFKLIEFHDCEFNYNNSATAWSKMDNKSGTAPVYTIDISYGDCYEISYNDLMHTVIGDIGTISTTTYYETQYDYVKKRIDPEEKSWFKKLGTGLLQRANNKALGMVKNMAYGNLYGFSLTDTLREIRDGIDNPMAAFDTIKKYVTNGKEIFNESAKQTKSISNVFKDNVHNSIGLNAFKAEYSSKNKNLGSIFKSTSIANNL